MTVSECEAVVFEGAQARHFEDLQPDTAYSFGGAPWRTLPRPGGEQLATVATVNDTHFGEELCGLAEVNVGPVLSVGAGEEPYPEVMNRAAVTEIASIGPDAVVAKGDLTSTGSPDEYALFEACYRPAFGDRLFVTLGNHDNRPKGRAFDVPAVQEVRLPGVTLAILDTTVPEGGGGRLTAEQLDWLDELGARADRTVLVFGHHPCWQAAPVRWSIKPNALDLASSEALMDVIRRRTRFAAYLCGHTHRNSVSYFDAVGPAVFGEVACVKDFPGSWAEYRVFEGGILQVHHRISSPDALAWSERCRTMFAGHYPSYALGELSERCFALPAS
jgi:3',5'-cyclic-AMP phosphodiesterase